MFSPKRRPATLMPAVALAALSAVVAIPALSQSRFYAAAPQRAAFVTVAHGENLWTIADRYTSNGESVQDTVDMIMAANKLQTASVFAGERLRIPR